MYRNDRYNRSGQLGMTSTMIKQCIYKGEKCRIAALRFDHEVNCGDIKLLTLTEEELEVYLAKERGMAAF